jgi:hypothetical protein
LASKHKDFIPLYAKIARDNISIDQSVFLSHSIYLRYLDEVLAGAGLCEFSCIFAERSDDAQALCSQSRRYLKNVLFHSVAGLHLRADLVRPSRQSKTGRPIVNRWLLKMLERIFGVRLLPHSCIYQALFRARISGVGLFHLAALTGLEPGLIASSYQDFPQGIFLNREIR